MDDTYSQTLALVASILESAVIQTSYIPNLRKQTHRGVGTGTIDQFYVEFLEDQVIFSDFI